MSAVHDDNSHRRNFTDKNIFSITEVTVDLSNEPLESLIFRLTDFI